MLAGGVDVFMLLHIYGLGFLSQIVASAGWIDTFDPLEAEYVSASVHPAVIQFKSSHPFYSFICFHFTVNLVKAV